MASDEAALEIHRLRARIRHLTAALEDFENHGLRSDLMPSTATRQAWTYDDWLRYLQGLDTSVRNRATLFLGPVRKYSSGTMSATKVKGK